MLTLICGLPRAGKTTYSERFNNVIHLDTSGAYNGVLRRLRHADNDVVIEGVYRKVSERNGLFKAFPTNRYICIWLDTPNEVRRSRKGWDRFCDQPFDPPTFDEGWDEIIVIRGDDEQRYCR